MKDGKEKVVAIIVAIVFIVVGIVIFSAIFQLLANQFALYVGCRPMTFYQSLSIFSLILFLLFVNKYMI